jgi:hypothetical protein
MDSTPKKRKPKCGKYAQDLNPVNEERTMRADAENVSRELFIYSNIIAPVFGDMY